VSVSCVWAIIKIHFIFFLKIEKYGIKALYIEVTTGYEHGERRDN